jgi:hypothetical protein
MTGHEGTLQKKTIKKLIKKRYSSGYFVTHCQMPYSASVSHFDKKKGLEMQ